MKWSELPKRQQQTYTILGIVVVVALIGLAIYGQNKQVGANSANGDSPTLDSGFGARTIRLTVKTTDKDGNAKAAFLDGLVNNSQDGLLGESDATGAGTLDLNDGQCYSVKATDKSGTAEGTVILAAGTIDTASCGDKAIALPKANTDPIVIKMQ